MTTDTFFFDSDAADPRFDEAAAEADFFALLAEFDANIASYAAAEEAAAQSPRELLDADPEYAAYADAIVAATPDPLPSDFQPDEPPPSGGSQPTRWGVMDMQTGAWRAATPEEEADLDAAIAYAEGDTLEPYDRWADAQAVAVGSEAC